MDDNRRRLTKIILFVFLTIAVCLIWIHYFSFQSDSSNSDSSNIDPENTKLSDDELTQGLPVLAKQFDIDSFLKIRVGNSENEVRSILGEPSDKGNRLDVLNDAIISSHTKPSPYNVFYLRYRYPKNRLIILLFDRETGRLLEKIDRQTFIFD